MAARWLRPLRSPLSTAVNTQSGLAQPLGKETPVRLLGLGTASRDGTACHPGARELGEFHAFIVSDLRELQSLAGQSLLLLRIYNPWGRRCWQGPWREG